jgi:hypothetical protein
VDCLSECMIHQCECRLKVAHGHLMAPRLCHAVMTSLCVFGMQ